MARINIDASCFPPAWIMTCIVDGTEFRPGNRRIVHHALVFLDASGKARELAAASPDGSYPCFGGPGISRRLD